MVVTQKWFVAVIVTLVSISVWSFGLATFKSLLPSGMDKIKKLFRQDAQELTALEMARDTNRSQQASKHNVSYSTRDVNKSLPSESDVLTHPDWIRLDNRLYKIYSGPATYDSAMQKCLDHHPDAELAAVLSFNHSQILGRHLLEGNPRLANAWIGARWYDGGYQFEKERIPLQNTSDDTGYPPWRHASITKLEKCILLDRHVKNFTVFLEANCERLRPYICYIENSTGFTDLIRGRHAYRLHYNKKNWIKARNDCKNTYAKYSARLVEIKEKVQLYDLFHLMKISGKTIQYVWIGGRLKRISRPLWVWDSDNSAVPVGYQSYMNWPNNNAYHFDEREENCIVADSWESNYGMACKYELSYVCQFSVENLKRLQEDEKSKQKQVSSKTLPKTTQKIKPPQYNPEDAEQISERNDISNELEKHNLYGNGSPNQISTQSLDQSDNARKNNLNRSWIRIGRYLYKIYDSRLSYDGAKQRCHVHHPDAQLAVVPSLYHAHVLSKYLSAGKSTHKKAWIGARWIGDGYQFEAEYIRLPNVSDAKGYPPWKNKTTQAKGRCIAFDRQADNMSLFVESRCEHHRPYICYFENNSGSMDLPRGDRAYRLHYSKRNWDEARDYCRNVYANYSGDLPEIKNRMEFYNLMQLMKLSSVMIRNIWVGGRFTKTTSQPLWLWNRSSTKINTGRKSLLGWINTTTYLASDEDDDCLLMSDLGRNFGAACTYEHSFVCQFSPEKFQLLLKDEKKHKK